MHLPTRFALLSTLLALAGASAPSPVEACGGFFCGQQPVDQSAERIIFAVDRAANTTDMIVQIGFQGNAMDFAWVVPLGSVPLEGSLDTFPQAAMTALDANSAPQIYGGGYCFDAAAGAPRGRTEDEDGEVIVHIRENVGPYDAAVIESDDPDALVTWLRDNGFRVTSPMEPYIAEYADAGMKFLALRLQPESKVSEIAPFRMTLPGTSPAVPLKMTALAAEPEMGILVFVFGDQRFEGANWPNLEIPDEDLVYDYRTGRHNWTSAVAHAVDEAGGQGWVTETAGSTADYLSRLDSTTPADEEQAEAVEALRDLIRPHSYMSRLYTRLSAEEMTSDPVFRRSSGGDVERFRMIMLEGMDECGGWDTDMPAVSECEFVACGAGGRCFEVAEGESTRAGCACVPGATARTTVGPDGRATIACQDMRMSFLNPGDRETPTSPALPDPCIGFSCGAGGTCVPMNMTPTCVCDRGLVAIGDIDEDGVRSTSCVTPTAEIPDTFYMERLADRPVSLPAGRDVYVAPVEVGGGGVSCSTGGAPVGLGGLGLCLVALFFIRRRSA